MGIASLNPSYRLLQTTDPAAGSARRLGGVAPSGEIMRARRAAFLGVRRPRCHDAQVTGAQGLGLAVSGDRHLAVDDQHAGIELVRVLGTELVRLHLALDHVGIALGLELLLEIGLVHQHRSLFGRYSVAWPPTTIELL